MPTRNGLGERVSRSWRRPTEQADRGASTCRYLALLLALFLAIPAWSQQKPADITEISIEDLMNIKVTSVTKEDQKMSQVAAAVFVISQQDIQRSGATEIPDLLRIVPGLDVAQINANTWAVSVRGFNSQFSNKMLVLVDSRAVYTPLFDQVSWDTVDVPLEDIDRIEVIRGPGGSVWGNNAVNGIVNIITKKAQDTPGAQITAGGGTAQGFGTVQYGAANRSTAYRVFAKYSDQNHFPDLNGQNAQDGSNLLHGGFRVDSDRFKNDPLTFEGDLYTGREGATIVHSVLSPPDNLIEFRNTELSGGDILGRWSHTFSRRSDATLQIYFDRYTRSGPESREVRNTVDLDFRHHVLLGSRHDLTWGLGYRHSADQTLGTIDQAFVPVSRASELFSFFVEDQITLKPNRLFLNAGTKVENSYFNGFDIEPSIGLAWTPSNRQTFWASISDTHRSPSRRDLDLNATLAALPGPAEVILFGNPNFRDEILIAYELGYRTQVNPTLSIDLATFLNSYYDLQTIEPLPSFVDSTSVPPLLVIPKSFANKMHGQTGGVEVSVNWKVTDRWTLSPGYSFLKMDLHSDPSSLDTVSVGDTEGSSPNHQAQLRSHVELPHGVGWDANLNFVGPLPAQLVPVVTRLDSQLTWQFAEQAQLSIVGQNLLSDHHVEFNDYLTVVNPSQVKRSVFARISWHF